MVFRVEVLRFREFTVEGLGFSVKGLMLRVQCLGLRVEGSGC